MLPSPVRRTAPLALIGLLVALFPVLVAVPAHASPGCTRETGALGSCDDTTPPVFTASNVTIDVAGSTASVTAQAGPNADGDTDPITYQCALDAAGFIPCAPYPGVAVGPHTMKVRAIDSHDQGITACEVVCPPLYTESANSDYTEITTQFTVNAAGGGGGGGGGTVPPPPGPGGAPETQITGGPSDKITPGQPVSLSKHPTIRLTASEAATYNCAINAKKVACHDGVNVLKGLKPGTQVFVAQAVDRDGNFDATPATITFYVPYNLTTHQGQGWKKVKARGSYSSDYVSTTHQGALLTLGRVKGVHELRLIAPTGPQLGKVAVRVGNGGWLKVDLKSATSKKLVAFEVRGTGASALSGAIQVKALTVPAGGAVAVDAIVAR